MFAFYVNGSVENILKVIKDTLEKINYHNVVIFDNYANLTAFDTYEILKLKSTITIFNTVIEEIYVVWFEDFIGNIETLQLSYDFMISNFNDYYFIFDIFIFYIYK